LAEPVLKIAIAIMGVSAMGRIVLPFALPLSQEPRRDMSSTSVQVVNVIARVVDLVVPIVVNLIVPVPAVIIVIVVVVVDRGITVTPVVISPRVTTGCGKSVADIGVVAVRISRRP
jgi:hypothetical protein